MYNKLDKNPWKIPNIFFVELNIQNKVVYNEKQTHKEETSGFLQQTI